MSDVSNPAAFAESIVYDVDFSGPCRSLYIAVTGNINVRMYATGQKANAGQPTPPAMDVIFNNVPVGIFPVQAIRINTASTTVAAANIIALR